jgi:hypothetical protein
VRHSAAVLTGAVGTLELVVGEFGEGGGEGAQRVGVGAGQGYGGRRGFAAGDRGQVGDQSATVRRLAEADRPPCYERAAAGSMLDPLEPVLRRLLEEWPEIKAPRVTELLHDDYGYSGSVDLVRRRLQGLRPREDRPAQQTGYRPGQVMQVDWAEMHPWVAASARSVRADGPDSGDPPSLS